MKRPKRAELTKFVVPATIMLSFVSFWRAAAIVLCDLGSSAYYVGGITEKAIGKAAPWFILGIMLFSYAVRAVYIESCSMFVRGGVYRVVREAMGSTAAKFSVSALLFDYVLTGPISAVSAGLYLAGLINESGEYFHIPWMQVPSQLLAAGFAVLVTLYFWYTNRVGIPFSSTKALRIMQITTVMVVLLIGWCLLTIFSKGFQPVPWPTVANLRFNDEALGWLKGTIAPGIAFVAILVGLGHSLLAMSGEESLAQVYREIEAPKHKNLIRTGLVIFAYSLLFTSLISFFAVMIVPDAERSKYFDNLIGGISVFLVGPFVLRLGFHVLVVLVGVLILSGAVNTAIIGSNGVMNRVAEDGVLPGWFRDPHPRYGTTHRIINLIVALQLATILISHGNVYMLGEAYAFGVVWSFAMKALAVVVLRFTEPAVPRWRVPVNLRVMGTEIPVGLILITTVLFLLAGINVLTKKIATISGAGFTVVFFVAFTISERYHKENQTKERPGGREESEEEKFRLEVGDHLSPESLSVRPDNIVVAVHDPNNLQHLKKVLEENDSAKSDVVVLSVNPNAPQRAREDQKLAERVMDECETRVFSNVVHVAEEVGKPALLVAIPGKDPYNLIMQAAQKLRSSRVVISRSSHTSLDKQEQEIRQAWEQLRQPRPQISVQIVPDDDEQEKSQVDLNPHLPGPQQSDGD
ncbi:MAG TPA: APC family permease [Acidobacteriota bacterium]